MINLMEKESIITMMDLVIQGNGLKIFNKVMVFKSGLMDHIMKGIFFLNLKISSRRI